MNDIGIGVLIGLLFGAFITSCFWSDANDKLKREAIENGVAEYVIVNQETGYTQFTWKKINPKNQTEQ